MKETPKKISQIEFDKWLISISEERNIYKIIFIYKELEKIKEQLPHAKEYIYFPLYDTNPYHQSINCRWSR